MKRLIIILLMGLASMFMYALTLEEARELAMEHNPELKAEYHSMQASKWNYRSSLMSLFPSATLNGNYGKLDKKKKSQVGTDSMDNPLYFEYDETKNYGVTVIQPIFNGGKIWLGARISGDAARISESAYASKRLNVLSETESKYYTVLENQELVQIARKSLESAQQNLDRAQVRYETGTLSRADILNMQSELASKDLQLIQMENVLSLSRFDLANYLQIEKVDDLQPIGSEEYEPEIEQVRQILNGGWEAMIEKIIELGMENNFSVKMAQRQVNMNSKSLLMAEGNFLPSVNLQYSRSWSAVEDEDFERDGQLMLTASMPIFPLVDNASDVIKAKHDKRNAEYSFRSTEDGIRTALRSAVYNLITAAKSVRASKLALDYAEETYEQMQERFNNELITTSDLLDSEVMLTSARSNYASSFYDYLRYRSTLLELMGTEDDAALTEVIKGE